MFNIFVNHKIIRIILLLFILLAIPNWCYANKNIEKIAVIYSYSLENQSEKLVKQFLKEHITNQYFLIEYYMKSDIQKDFYFNKRHAAQLIYDDIQREKPDLIILVGDEAYYFAGIQFFFQQKLNIPVIVLSIYKLKLDEDAFFYKEFVIYYCKFNQVKIKKLFSYLPYNVYILYGDTLFSKGIVDQLKNDLTGYPFKIHYVKITNKGDLKNFIHKINEQLKKIIVINTLIYIEDFSGNMLNFDIAKYLYSKTDKYIFLINFFKKDLPFSSFIITCSFKNDEIFTDVIPNYTDLSNKGFVIPRDLWKYLE